jgi:hypothetical protein
VLGVNTPRFSYTAERGTLAAGLTRLGVDFPVALDSGHALWHEYGCVGWPSLFLWSRGGVLHWYHFGEGEYDATEREIQSLVDGVDDPRTVAPVRPGDAPGALVMPPTPEVFPGGAPDSPWTADGEGEQLTFDYEAGGASVSVDGEGELVVSVDRGAEHGIAITAPGVHELTNHAHHEPHTLALRPSAGLRLYSVAFAPGVP